MTKFFTRVLLTALTAGALFAAAITPEANASDTLHVHLMWGPNACISVVDPTGGHTACGGSADATYFARPGDWIGVDPIIGTNEWVGCSIANSSGVIFFSDFGTLGDGHDINCLGNYTEGANPRMVI